MRDTPRTEALLKDLRRKDFSETWNSDDASDLLKLARILERELNKAKKDTPTADAVIWRDACNKATDKLAAVTKERDEANEKINLLLAHCKDGECSVCSQIVCPHHDEMHFHHDGCPSCTHEENK